jgi:hypothetical protein
MAAVFREEQTLFNRLGNDLPMQFKNNMVGAMESVLDETTNLGDALEGVALEFLRTMRRAFIESAVSNMMNIGSAMVPSWNVGGNKTDAPSFEQRGGFISAQGGRLVPGRGSGDKVPILAEPGEFVVNREAVNAVGAGNLNALNTAIPRFQTGGAVNLALKPDSPELSGFFLSEGNAETAELADDAVKELQKAQQKDAKKNQMKQMLLSTLMSATIGLAMKGAGKWVGNRGATSNLTGATTSRKGMTNFIEQGGTRKGAMSLLNRGVNIDDAGIPQYGNPNIVGGFQRNFSTGMSGGGGGGSWAGSWGRGGREPSRQQGGFVGGNVARRYGLFQGGGSVSAAPSAGALGANTNNISINIDIGGSKEAGDGRSQSDSGNSGAPDDRSTRESDARALSEKIKAQVVKVITEEQRVGGSLSPAVRRP